MRILKRVSEHSLYSTKYQAQNGKFQGKTFLKTPLAKIRVDEINNNYLLQ